MNIKELGHVVLYVTNLERSANFYRDTLGFKEIFRGGGAAAFSSGRTHHEMLLIEVGGSSVTHAGELKPGLYHIGFKIGDGPQAAKEAYQELKKKSVEIVGTADHGVTHSIYILDPDGNELELYSDVSDAWKKDPKAVMSPTKTLNLE